MPLALLSSPRSIFHLVARFISAAVNRPVETNKFNHGVSNYFGPPLYLALERNWIGAHLSTHEFHGYGRIGRIVYRLDYYFHVPKASTEGADSLYYSD